MQGIYRTIAFCAGIVGIVAIAAAQDYYYFDSNGRYSKLESAPPREARTEPLRQTDSAAGSFGFSMFRGWQESENAVEPQVTASTPVEIWLGEQVGRFGPHEFEALGGRNTHPTPRGRFTVKSKHEDFYSRKYKSPMPLAIFFTDQCAIHVGSLRVSSHGCIHVDWEAAQLLFRHAKPGVTRVVVHP